MNEDVQAVLDYHRATNHSVESIQSNNLALDFSNLPRTYKLYRKLETVPLVNESVASTIPAFSALSTPLGTAQTESAPDLATLSTLLKFSAGITKWLPVPNGKMAFRAASCTGAMYHIELYVVCGELEGLPAGVYQFGVHDNALRRVRSGDFRGALTDAAGNHSGVADAPITIVYTSVFWRNAWKYQDRAYRHAYWDGGTILANTLALATSHGLPASVVTGFVDGAVNRLVDVDGAKESALFMVPIGYAPSMQSPDEPAPERAKLETLPYSPQEVNYPLIRSTHDVTSLADADAVRSWRSSVMSTSMPAPTAQLTSLTPVKHGEQPQASVDEVIQQRGSTRRFQEISISYADFSAILSTATVGVPGDYVSGAVASLNDMYLIVNAVEGLPSGTYVYHPNSQELELLKEGQFREDAGHLGLNQILAHDAAVNVYFMADLDEVTAGLGPRGYRASQLDASTTAGRLYLSAYALGLGASGLTFFDDEVTEFFRPHSTGKSVMFLVLLGAPAYRKNVDRDRTWFTPELPKQK